MIRLSNHPRPIVGLEGYGIEDVESRPITSDTTAFETPP